MITVEYPPSVETFMGPPSGSDRSQKTKDIRWRRVDTVRVVLEGASREGALPNEQTIIFRGGIRLAGERRKD